MIVAMPTRTFGCSPRRKRADGENFSIGLAEKIRQHSRAIDFCQFALFKPIERGAGNTDFLSISSALKPDASRKAFSRFPISS